MPVNYTKMTKTIKEGRKKGQGRKPLPEGERKVTISALYYIKQSDLAKIKSHPKEYNAAIDSVNQLFKKKIENILKIV